MQCVHLCISKLLIYISYIILDILTFNDIIACILCYMLITIKLMGKIKLLNNNY